MTICIAAACQFNYSLTKEPDIGSLVITATDRMFTDSGLGVEYETGQGKYANIGKHAMILVSDSISLHSLMLVEIKRIFSDTNPTVAEVATTYAKLVAQLRAERAEREFLSPFQVAIKDLYALPQDSILYDIREKILSYELPVQTIACGHNADGSVEIFSIDGSGQIHSHIDIGSGEYHANSYLMTSRKYWNRLGYIDAISAVYLAKKRAETAPGVGSVTDMCLIGRHGSEKLTSKNQEILDKSYPAYIRRLRKLESSHAMSVWKEMAEQGPKVTPGANSTQPVSEASSSKDQT